MTRTRSIYLTRQHFFAMLCVALAVHLVLGVSWALSPALKVNKVPVHVLNIKLGSGDVMAMVSSGMAEDASKATLSKVSRQPNPTPPPREDQRQESMAAKKSGKQPRQQNAKSEASARQAAQQRGRHNAIQAYAPTGSATNAPLSSHARPSQYVRRSGDARGEGDGSAVGNSLDAEAQVMQRYTQLISLWINRQKAILNRAVQPGMRGNVVIRLRIDRMGKIHFFKLDKATGVPAVDAAAADMVRAANPVPPVPSNYPGGNMFEFLIPVGYSFGK